MTALRRTHSTARAEDIPTVTRTEARPKLETSFITVLKGNVTLTLHLHSCARKQTTYRAKRKSKDDGTNDLGSWLAHGPNALLSRLSLSSFWSRISCPSCSLSLSLSACSSSRGMNTHSICLSANSFLHSLGQSVCRDVLLTRSTVSTYNEARAHRAYEHQGIQSEAAASSLSCPWI